MCGVVGCIGKDAIKIGIDMLKKLEYRGYDSAGISFFNNENIETIKSVGKIDCLTSKINKNFNTDCVIGHTRWATHGKPCDENSHPHNSFNNEWTVVHNGIIENYKELKECIDSENLISETDTEIFAKLLETTPCENVLQNIINCCKKVKGSYAFAILNKRHQDTIFLAKRESPLFVAGDSDHCFIASDPIAFVGKIDNFYSLDNDEFCVIKKGSIMFYNSKMENIIKNKSNIEIDKTEAELNGYSHFMLKEIEETPSVLKNIVNIYEKQNIFENLFFDVNQIDKIKIIGCGTAYHSGLIGSLYLKQFLNIETEVCLASEFRYSNPLIDNKTLCIFVSQSGETADTLGAVDLALERKCKTIALTNVTHSTITQKVEYVLPIFAGPEIAVASTKAYTAQCLVFYLFANYLKLLKYNQQLNFDNIIENINKLSINIKKIINDLSKNIDNAVEKIAKAKNVFFIGRSWDYYTCLEASLKLKEISYINCWGIAAGELKHGSLALIEENVLTIVILTDESIADKTINAIEQIKARGANVMLISNLEQSKNSLNLNDIFIKLPNDCEKELLPLLSTIPTQLLAYYVSVKKGLNPDKPRNLAKSVTVE